MFVDGQAITNQISAQINHVCIKIKKLQHTYNGLTDTEQDLQDIYNPQSSLYDTVEGISLTTFEKDILTTEHLLKRCHEEMEMVMNEATNILLHVDTQREGIYSLLQHTPDGKAKLGEKHFLYMQLRHIETMHKQMCRHFSDLLTIPETTYVDDIESPTINDIGSDDESPGSSEVSSEEDV